MKYSHQTADHEISLQLLNPDKKEEAQKEHDWLSDQFSRFPYMIYKFWLVLTIIIVISLQPDLILSQFKDLEPEPRLDISLLILSSILTLIGCIEMLFAMTKRKSGFAQKSLLKFQLGIIGAICAWNLQNKLHFDFKFFLFERSLIAFPLSVVINLAGAFAVLKAFKKNHPLARSQGTQDADFLEQNEVIASQLLKYDEQLKRWPYQIYRFWLRFVIFMEIFLIPITLLKFKEENMRNEAITLIIWSLLAFCCYEMEMVFRRKMLEKSKKALFHLKICIFLSGLIPAIIAIFNKKFFSLETLYAAGFFSVLPLITLVGAFYVNRIIEQRDQFVKVSSYSGDHYL